MLVSEPTVEETIEILKGLKHRYEEHHGVTYTDEALVAAAELSSRYVSDRFLPDKAIDLIDEAGAMVKMRAFEAPSELRSWKRSLEKIIQEKEDAVAAQEFEKAASAKR